MKRHLSCSFLGSRGNRQMSAGIVGILAFLAMGTSACSVADIVDKCNNQCLSGEVCQDDGVCRIMCLPDGSCKDPLLTCQDGLCKTESELLCAIGSTKCSPDNKSVLRCGNDMHFEVKETCTTGRTCNSGQCMEEACEDGALRCHDGNVEKCVNHGYIIYTECEAPERCDPGSFKCVVPPECTDGTKRCNNNDLDICVDGAFQSLKKCPQGQACDSSTLDCAKTAECTNGAKECVGDGYRECSGGRWHNKSCVGALVCTALGECAAACTDGDTRCATRNGSDVVETCKNGAFSVSQPCDSPQQCHTTANGAACVEPQAACTTQAYRCVDNGLQKCDASTGEYKTVRQCDKTQACSATKADCESLCGNGNIDTAAGEDCDSDILPSNATCATIKGEGFEGLLKCNPATCKFDTSSCKKNDCTDGDKICSESVLKSCSNGAWLSKDCAAQDMVCHLSAEDGCYKPKTVEGYDYIQDFEVFEGWKKDNSYKTFLSDDKTPPVVYSFRARTDTLDNNYAIEKRSIILKKDKADSYFKVTNLEKGIKKLSFKWRKWSSGDASAQIQIIVGDKVIGTIDTSKEKTDDVKTFVIDVPEDARGKDSFEIKPTVGGARIIIDDIMWSNK